MILAGGNSERMKELSYRRAIAAMPMAGSFRSIDFALSSMSNSGIQKVAVLTQYNSRSLNEHLSSSKWWDLGRKQGGLFIFPPMVTAENSFWYRGTADAIHQNLDFLRESHEPYVVIASGDGIYKLDYTKVLEYHIAKQADVTVVCKEISQTEDATRFGVLQLDEDDRIVQFDEKPREASSQIISCGIYVIRRRQLIGLIEKSVEEGRYDFVKDVLIRSKDTKRLYGYRLETYWSNIASVDSYYRTNMDFLKKEVRDYFFHEYPDVRSRVDDNPPAKYNPGSEVKNSLISNGSIINGYVENSIIFRKVFVGNNCTIKNSIILNDVHIGNEVYLENCIVEGRTTISAGARYVGEDGIRIIIETNK